MSIIDISCSLFLLLQKKEPNPPAGLAGKGDFSEVFFKLFYRTHKNHL